MNKIISIDQIKILVIESIVSDDHMYETLVLKGGNALNLVHKVSFRGSLDLDFSMDSDFADHELPEISNRIQRNLIGTFARFDHEVLDFKFEARPEKLSEQMKDFWGGYQITFKLVSLDSANEVRSKRSKRIERSKSIIMKDLKDNSTQLDAIRKVALPLGKGNSTTFKVDISSHEFCDEKIRFTIDGYSVFVYPLPVIAFEKIRAICQQLPEYIEKVGGHPVSRARDFFDIFIISEHVSLLVTPEYSQIAERIFTTKRVPLSLINKIKLDETYQFHLQSFPAVQSTTLVDENLKPFSFYFQHTLAIVNQLKVFWNI